MIVKHIGADGNTRRVYLDISSTQMAGASLVALRRKYYNGNARNGTPLYEKNIVLISLAPGESLETDD